MTCMTDARAKGINMTVIYLWFIVVFVIARSNGKQECQEALGIENGAIADGQITASSFHNHNIDHRPYLARLHLQATGQRVGSWVTGTQDLSQWLQIDLGDLYSNITRVATQGRNGYNQWVTKYNLQYSDDGVAFDYYKDEQGQTKNFTGNADQNTVVSHQLKPPIRARYIRFRPVAWYTIIAMRVELYGCTQECQQALGMANGAITDGQITASSQWDPITHSVNLGRLFCTSNAGAWVALTGDANQWLQVDLGGPRIKVTRVATQGRANFAQWVTTYMLQHSNSGENFRFYREQGQTEDKVFAGNTDQNTVVSHELNPPIRVRYIRFRPQTWKGTVSMRVELYGCTQECQDALGMEDGVISDAQISASSHGSSYPPKYARLNSNSGSRVWKSKHENTKQWLQIDVLGLGKKYTTVTRVATQGRKSSSYPQRVTMYKLQYSNDGKNFQYYREQGQTTDTEFVGNVDIDTPVHHELNPPIRARYIRFRPMTWNRQIAMRVEIYGCKQECAAPAVGIDTGDILDSQLTASSGEPSQARLNGRFAWCPLSESLSEFIQVDFGRLFRVCAVATQGNPRGNKEFLKEYKLMWSNDNRTWKTSTEVLEGNTNWRDKIKNFVPVIYARYIRLYPLKWYVRGCVRMEIYGEPWPEVPGALFTPIGPGKALHGHVISSLNDTNAMECMKFCLVTEQCKSFNFSNKLKKCEVSGSKAEAHGLKDQEGFNYYEPASYKTISP